MSREIEFRGLATNGEFVCGSLVSNCVGLANGVGQNTKTWIVTSAFGNGGWFNIRGRQYVKPETVGQFTGLIDCNGTKIFEGDILASFLVGTNEILKVDVATMNRFPMFWLENEEFGFEGESLDSPSEFRVIGNIHQNSELLK